MVDCGEIRKKCNDASYKQCSRVVTCLKERESRDVFWHRQCYSEFTKKEHIQLPSEESSVGNKVRRSHPRTAHKWYKKVIFRSSRLEEMYLLSDRSQNGNLESSPDLRDFGQNPKKCEV